MPTTAVTDQQLRQTWERLLQAELAGDDDTAVDCRIRLDELLDERPPQQREG